MKPEYEEKIDDMHKNSRGRIIATYFAERHGKPVTSSEIMELVGISKTQARNAVSTLRVSGWNIENIAENGLEAQWVLVSVGSRKGGAPLMVKPKLNPLIESVFC